MKHTFSLLVAVVIVGLCYSQDPTPDPAKGKCPREFSMLEYMLKPKPCREEKPYCPEGLMCCPCPKSGKKFCIRPRMNGEELSAEEEKSFWEEMKMKLMGKEGEDYECDDDDDDDDDDDHHEKEDKVFETDRFADEEHHKNHHKKHRMRCHHHKRIHKIMKIAAPIVGLVVLITIVAIVACCIRRRRQRMRKAAETAKNNTYTPGTFAPVPDKSTMKGFLGLDFSPEVFVKSDPPYKKLEEEKDRI
eukprot:XP_011425151.1 PREDICTED: uncharacterized protein LOC105326687 [Crassostrea gigas]